MKGIKFKIFLRGHPSTHDIWFDLLDALAFEDEEFTDISEANEALVELCIEHGTDDEPNFSAIHPVAMSLEDYNVEMGDDVDEQCPWY